MEKTPRGSDNRRERAKKLVGKVSALSEKPTKLSDPEKTFAANHSIGLKRGGAVSGAMPKKRLDKPRRYATGGGVDGDMPKKKGNPKTEVNIVIAGKEGQPLAPSIPPQIPPMAAPPMPQPTTARPSVPPQGATGIMPPAMHKRGGAVKGYPIDAGAGGGTGRIEKAAAQKSHRPKKGGGK